jgi:hypothetical protein
VAWVFQKDAGLTLRGTYLDFKKSVAEAVGIKSNSVYIVGSAKLGYSLSPEKRPLLKAFNSKSDIDVVIASDELFAQVWGSFHRARYAGYDWVEDMHGREIFRKYIVLKSDQRYPSTSEYLREVAARMRVMKRDVQDLHQIKQRVNYRLYESIDAAMVYYAWSIGMLKERLKSNA